MDSLQRLLVHVDGSPRSAMRIRLARAIAAGRGAHVSAMLAADPPWQVVPMEAVGDGGSAALLAEAQAERRRAALDLVEQERERPGEPRAPLHWLEDDAPGAPVPASHAFASQALCSDLAVLGQHDPADARAWGVPADFAAQVMAASGRAALIVPWAGEWTRAPERALVAWKPTREAAAAVTAALPLLRQAREVVALAWSDGGALAARGGDDPLRLRRLQVWLSAHGIDARIEPQGEPQGPAPSAGLGELLLSAAADHGSDLLVMGCYGHTRMREWVFGGVTRTVLDSMTLPVLMAR